MTIHRNLRRLAAASLAASALAGCAAGSHPVAAKSRSIVFTGTLRPVVAGSIGAAGITAGQTAFGLDLFRRVCAVHPSANAVLSPVGAAQALGMLDAGARGSTRRAVSRLLRLPDWSPAVVGGLHNSTAAVSGLSQVAVSNHVFEQLGAHPTQRTLDDLRQAYGADIRALDFATQPAKATVAVNGVVSADTHGLVPKLFGGPLDPATQTVLTDAIYLHADWQTRFGPTDKAPFRTAAGTTVTARMMDGTNVDAPLRAAGGWQSATLPYRGSRLEAVALLPPATAQRCPVPGPATLMALTSGASRSKTGVLLPRLHLSQDYDLTQTLASMGLPLEGDYTGLGGLNSEISAVEQKVVLDVNRNGATAAAATGVAVTTLALVGPLRLLVFDRPFLLLIRDTATHAPLFLAYVADPA